MHDPDTLLFRIGPLTVWHHDPCTDGTDDSCGHKRTRIDPKLLSKLEYLATRYPVMPIEELFHTRLKYPDPVTGHTCALILLELVHEWMGRPVRDWTVVKHHIATHLWRSMAFLPGYHSNSSSADPESHGFRQYRRDIVVSVARSIMERARPYRWYHSTAWHVHHWRLHLRPFWRREEVCACQDATPKSKTL